MHLQYASDIRCVKTVVTELSFLAKAHNKHNQQLQQTQPLKVALSLEIIFAIRPKNAR